jgi:uncharacterized repeat protein (TIGR03803 family)
MSVGESNPCIRVLDTGTSRNHASGRDKMTSIKESQIKSHFKSKVFLLLASGIGCMLFVRVSAQTFTVLHRFTATSNSTNGDGASPQAGLILSGSILYGTAEFGGSSGNGAVFAINIDGGGFTNLHSFNTGTYSSPTGNFTNGEGAAPRGGLLLFSNTLYGTTSQGGTQGAGTVFAINADGSNFTNLHSFSSDSNDTNADGNSPLGGLILLGNTLYGTAVGGGTFGRGTVFAINTDGSQFTNLHSFANYNDGATPYSGLLSSGNTLYGTTSTGGSEFEGTVFAINTDGSVFTNLHSFTKVLGNFNSDGCSPCDSLVLSGSILYGTAFSGGSLGEGTVFAINTNGIGFTNLHSFDYINGDGALPSGGLVFWGNTLFGTSEEGGSFGNGAVFKLNADGTGYTTLYSFTGTDSDNSNSDGATPLSSLVLSGNTLYGTTSSGGNAGNGTVFSLSVGTVNGPQLAIIPYGANVILTWPSAAAGFNLQFTTNLSPVAVWKAVSSSPVVIGGQNVVLNPIARSQMFFRLSQ